jgi:hypothetical protein
MFRSLLVLTLLTFFGLGAVTSYAQYDYVGTEGLPHRCQIGNYGFEGPYQPACHAYELGHCHLAHHGHGQNMYGQIQYPPMLAPQPYAPQLVVANEPACHVCQQDSASINGNQPYANTAIALPNNLGPGPMSPLPSTFAATPPSGFGNQLPASDNHAGHDHANHDHGNHDHANHNHADHNHTNPQQNNAVQASPQIALPALAQTVERGHAQVLQNDSPLMSGSDQLGTIDRGQVLKVLNMQGNWIQLETNWLGKNAWIRKETVQMNEISPQGNQDVAPLAN